MTFSETISSKLAEFVNEPEPDETNFNLSGFCNLYTENPINDSEYSEEFKAET